VTLREILLKKKGDEYAKAKNRRGEGKEKSSDEAERGRELDRKQDERGCLWHTFNPLKRY
jgi:hypothetical protein